jgi:predicted transcriptional regulator YheO
MHDEQIEFLKRLAHGIAIQFGKDCEVVVHDLHSADPESTIVAIENGHVTNRKVGDGPSNVVLHALKDDPAKLDDELAYLTRTESGHVLKSTTVYLRDDNDVPSAIFAINYDMTMMLAMQDYIGDFTAHVDDEEGGTPTISQNVNNLLDELIEQSVKLVGKPVTIMTKEDKVKAIGFLDEAGAFLITKSGQKVCSYFGISKYTLYSYLEEVRKDTKKSDK